MFFPPADPRWESKNMCQPSSQSNSKSIYDEQTTWSQAVRKECGTSSSLLCVLLRQVLLIFIQTRKPRSTRNKSAKSRIVQHSELSGNEKNGMYRNFKNEFGNSRKQTLHTLISSRKTTCWRNKSKSCRKKTMRSREHNLHSSIHCMTTWYLATVAAVAQTRATTV